MLNFMVANLQDNRRLDKRMAKDKLLNLVHAQIENSLEVGWPKEKILIMSNFDFEFMGVKPRQCSLNNFCLTGSKMFGVWSAFQMGLIIEEIWSHDLDAWQNVWFEAPEFLDMGIVPYSTSRYNGGSVFFKPVAKDIVEKIVNIMNSQSSPKEEPVLNKLLKSKEYKDRVTVLNNTYNVGCSGFVKRYMRSDKPVRVCHFRPNNKIAWETHILDRNGVGPEARSAGERLEKIMRKYFPGLATELSEDGKRKQETRKASGSVKI